MVLWQKAKTWWKQTRSAVTEARRILRTINPMMKSIDRTYVRMTWFGAAFQGLSTLGTFAIFGVLLQQVTDGYLSPGQITARTVSLIIIVATGFFLASAVATSFGRWREEVFDDQLDHLLELQHIKKILSLDLGRLSDPEFLAVKESAEHRGKWAVKKLFFLQTRLLAAFVGVVASVSTVLILDPILLALALLPVVPRTVRAAIIAKRRRALWEESHLQRRKQQEYSYCLRRRNTLVQHKLFRFIPYMLEKYTSFTIHLRDKELELKKFDFTSSLWLQILQVGLLAAAMAYLGRGLLEGSLDIAKLYFFVGCMRTIGNSLFDLTSAGVDMAEYSLDYQYMEKFLAATPLIDETGAEDYRFTSTPKLTLDNVTFSYPRQVGRLALNGCSLTIEPGEKVAIVGRNGSGKTTIVRLLAKIFLPDTGEVLINQVPTHRIRQECWLDHALCVTQDSELADFNIEEAVTGKTGEAVDRVRLERSFTLSGADEFISRLPDGSKTQIGEEWPGGVGFSSGQLQRLKLAAAFYRILDPTVHIGFFDEPMSHCDVQTRERFYSSLGAFADKTIVVVAHDPLYLHHFERVVVVDDGRVVHDLRGDNEIERYKSSIGRSLLFDL